ncbi:MAG: phosphatidate cytidylyltransferase [Oscillospiraceae bacterium]|nr:phosphatidate cytidylyltransferase [Oscillospiraceae bacterium]
MSSLQSRILVGVIGAPALIAIVLWAPTFVITAVLAVLAGIGVYELMKCIGAVGYIRDCAIFTTVLSVLWSVAAENSLLISVIWMAYVFAVFLYAVVKGGEIKLSEVTAGMFAVIGISYSFSAFLRINDLGLHRAWLLLPFILSFACDTFAFIVGCSIGKHKLAPKVSPKKSVEGAVGGLAGNVLGGCVFVFVMDRFFGGAGISYGLMAVLSLCCGFVAQLGDLSFSLIKREYGIKDYGKIFLAHGGVLDRFDSVLFVAPVIEIILKLAG